MKDLGGDIIICKDDSPYMRRQVFAGSDRPKATCISAHYS